MNWPAKTRIRGQPADGAPADRQSHFTVCPGCGARIDMRDLDEVVRHIHGEEVPFTWRGKKQEE